jgi:hypothetical protein
MTNCKSVLYSVISVMAFVVAAMSAEPTLTFTFHTVDAPGAQSTAVYGINNSNAMVGSPGAGSAAPPKSVTPRLCHLLRKRSPKLIHQGVIEFAVGVL